MDNDSTRLVTVLSTIFKMKDLGAVNNILGINIKRDSETGSIKLSQPRYIADLCIKLDMENSNAVDTLLKTGSKLTKNMSPEEVEEMKNKPYRSLIGALVYLSNTTKLDIVIAELLTTSAGNPYWLTLMLIELVTYERKSTSGYIMTLASGPISWQMRKQKSVALSTMETEYMALSDEAKEVIYLRKLMVTV
ncbi:secreted RxLR effector protein 161-like [Chelonus insularis]|uniref:secreted RxLR effector protein 161-like n=1 Tax=Chelonus insularis TaxID=460826 RepID=UPI00158BCB52|nr:secreted RxLR effector protein 161-like [Chelonus insularis]